MTNIQKIYWIIGGSFDPAHEGHLVYQNCSKKIKLKKITGLSPKKIPLK